MRIVHKFGQNLIQLIQLSFLIHPNSGNVTKKDKKVKFTRFRNINRWVVLVLNLRK